MDIFSAIDHAFIRVFDFIFDRLPQPVPGADALKRCKIISHRGEHDRFSVKENTIAAFEQAAAAGVWGIELDVRWTRDLVPVVAHDPDLKRVFGLNDFIAAIAREKLRQLAPEIPSLTDVVQRFGSRLHLMIEIKQNQWPDAERQIRALKSHLASLKPVSNYHLMALQPDVLTRLHGFPCESLVAIANYRPDHYSRWVTARRWGGLCAHYGLMRGALIRRHHRRKQNIGTAYPASRNCLFREINRGVDWIFSNNAAALQRIIDQETIRG